VGFVARNVTALVDPPRVARREMHRLSPQQVRAILTAATGDRLEALWIVAITTGMRQGELLGLRWRDVDLDGRAVSVRASLERIAGGLAFADPKTAHSRRRVSLTDVAIAALRRHRAVQLQDRLAAGSEWVDSDVVFATHAGRPLHASFVLGAFRAMCVRAGVPRIRFHDLRHTAATLLLGRGVHPKIVSEMLGHSTIAITLDLYSHVTPTMQRDAAVVLDAVLRR
jgi:integrase